MDNNNNDLMSIFNGNHVDPNKNPENNNINNEPTDNEPKFIKIDNEQINEQILEQSDILNSVTDIEQPPLEEPKKIEETDDHISFISILVFSLVLGVVAFAGISFAEEQLFKPKDSKKLNELTEKAHNFEQSFSTYITQYNLTHPIKETISCTSNTDSSWHKTTNYEFTENCKQLIENYQNSGSSLEMPSYGVLVINNKGIKNGTKLIYGEYTCSYDSTEEKMFKCEKTE